MKENDLVIFDPKDVDSLLLLTSSNQDESALILPPSLNFPKEEQKSEQVKEDEKKEEIEEKLEVSKVEIVEEEKNEEEGAEKKKPEENRKWGWKRKKIGVVWSLMEEKVIKRLMKGKRVYQEWKRKIKRSVCMKEFPRYFSLKDINQMNKEIRNVKNRNESDSIQNNHSDMIPFYLWIKPNNTEKHFRIRIRRIFDFPLVVGTILKRNSNGDR